MTTEQEFLFRRERCKEILLILNRLAKKKIEIAVSQMKDYNDNFTTLPRPQLPEGEIFYADIPKDPIGLCSFTMDDCEYEIGYTIERAVFTDLTYYFTGFYLNSLSGYEIQELNFIVYKKKKNRKFSISIDTIDEFASVESYVKQMIATDVFRDVVSLLEQEYLYIGT